MNSPKRLPKIFQDFLNILEQRHQSFTYLSPYLSPHSTSISLVLPLRSFIRPGNPACYLRGTEGELEGMEVE
jgi:hypothetical protein